MAGRADHRILLAAALGCAAAFSCFQSTELRAEDAAATAAVTPALPIASDARLAGDSNQTRFILDLDRSVPFRAFALADPYRVVVDVPQVDFRLATGTGATGRGLIKAFRYGLVMPGGSRLVFDLAGPAKITKAYSLDAANNQPPRFVLELEAVDPSAFASSLGTDDKPNPNPDATATAVIATAPIPVEDGSPALKPVEASDKRPVVVIDPGHGGIDNGTQAGGETEKNLVLNFSTALRDRIEKTGKYRVIMTRTDDTFIPLGERVKVARGQAAALLVSIHADALPHREGDTQGATVYTLSDRASDAEAERLAESENKADAIGGVNLTDEPAEVADILIDLAQRETRTFSNRFARLLVREMKTSARMHKRPLKSAGFKVLKAPDVPSVLIELGYVSNKGDLEHLMSEEWRAKTAGSVAQAIDAFFAKRVVTAGPPD